jgi:hypothetical protein
MVGMVPKATQKGGHGAHDDSDVADVPKPGGS